MKARRQKRALDAAGDTAALQTRDDGAPWIATPPAEKVDPGMLLPAPPHESVDPGMLIQPQRAEGIETPSGGRAKESKSVSITPEAARYVVERARHYTGRFGIVSFAWQLAAEELKKRATIDDGVIRLRPPSALDRFVEDYKRSSHGARDNVRDFADHPASQD